MPNTLSNENSPYLLQHANNPVDWFPWGRDALEKARLLNRPIFLSIGYAACHWCHVMAHESFEDPETAAFMNAHFINIKVDREERPDLDQIYMNAVVAMTGQGGWPMSVFLTPAGEPFYGGTYYPPKRRYNMPSFQEVLHAVQRAWQNDRQGVLKSGQKITEHLHETSFKFPTRQEFDCDLLEIASSTLIQAYDWKHGGWGSAPKFPQPMAIEFLLRRASRGDKLALQTATHALRAMARGGMYDVVGGGFSRYSTDDNWLIPHFEKMLYDNAQLALAYLHGFLLSGDLDLKRTCIATLDFLMRELRDSEGGFYSSIDADSEGKEGKYYLWTPAQVHAALPDHEDAELITRMYQVTEQGNFEGSNVLQRISEDAEYEITTHINKEALEQRLAQLQMQLLNDRNKRTYPAIDDKVLVSWNALTLVAFAEAARYLQRPEYLEVAIRNAGFLLNNLRPAGKLMRSWRAGKTQHHAFLEDHSALILGLLSLYQSDPDICWYNAAQQVADDMLVEFTDPAGGFFDTSHRQEQLYTRPKDLQDNATPCGNALAAMALFQLSGFSDSSDFRTIAEDALAMISASAHRYPTAFGFWLQAADFASAPQRQVAIIGNPADPRTTLLVNSLWSTYQPNIIAAIGTLPLPQNAPPLLQSRQPNGDVPTAYVCTDFVCNLPATDPQKLNDQIKGTV